MDVILLCCFKWAALPVKFWEDFWPELITGIISSGLGFWGAFYLFTRSMRLEKKKDSILRELELQDIIRFIKYSFKRLIEPEKSIVESLKMLVTALNAGRVQDVVITFRPAFNFQWMDGIDKIKLQKVFLKYISGSESENIDKYNEFLTYTDLITTINKRLYDDFMRYIDESRRLEGLFNEEKVRIARLNEPITAKIISSGNGAVFTIHEKEVIAIFKGWMDLQDKKEKGDMFVFFEKVISPGKLLRFGWETKNFEIIDAVRNMTFAFESYKKNQELNNVIFSSYIKNIDDSFKKMQDIINKFDIV